MDDDLIQELQAVAAEAPDFEPRPLKNPDNRWLVRSAFQKAIRRGETDRALRMGEYLMDLDGSQCWTSLATVVVEDVGFGDLDLLTYSTVTTLKSLRDKMHAHLLFGAMIKRACEAPKSRSCCELSLGADKGGGYLWPKAKEMTEAELHKELVSGDMPRAYVAAAVLRKNLRGTSSDMLMPTLQLIMETLTDPAEQRAAMMSFERTVDNMNVALFPVLHRLNLVGQEIEETDERQFFPEEEVILSVSSAAFDMHTLHGKKAIKAFWKWLCASHDWAKEIAPDDAVRAIGSLVFIVEGGLVDRRLLSPELEALKLYQDTNFAKGYGMPEHLVNTETEFFAHMCNVVHINVPKLNELRKWAVS